MPGVLAPGAARRRARRWFWLLLTLAVAGVGLVRWAVRAAPTPAGVVLVLLASLVVLGALVQASRIWTALEGPSRLPRLRHQRRPGD
ncbi:hypothetical protein ATJ97_0281 [Georgenia soli]|uniref:Uncharacterized protein n=1 Tax=Georgenia soli TaxID=638953 RepID=A0A2A9F3B3_9MICO|nr:hypothetical protein [Georgenia soli]PFG45000.1 hypothetical protein ATJ97_0281 [Georgenia soli]